MHLMNIIALIFFTVLCANRILNDFSFVALCFLARYFADRAYHKIKAVCIQIVSFTRFFILTADIQA